jgi:hypothetical protein
VTAPLILPVPQPTAAAGWQVYAYRTVTAQTPAAAGGLAQLTLPQLDSGVQWLIDHAVVQCTSTSYTALRLFDSQISPLALIDGSNSGNFDVADWPNGLTLQSGRQLLAQWSSASDGSVGTLMLQLRELRQGVS